MKYMVLLIAFFIVFLYIINVLDAGRPLGDW